MPAAAAPDRVSEHSSGSAEEAISSTTPWPRNLLAAHIIDTDPSCRPTTPQAAALSSTHSLRHAGPSAERCGGPSTTKPDALSSPLYCMAAEQLRRRRPPDQQATVDRRIASTQRAHGVLAVVMYITAAMCVGVRLAHPVARRVEGERGVSVCAVPCSCVVVAADRGKRHRRRRARGADP